MENKKIFLSLSFLICALVLSGCTSPVSSYNGMNNDVVNLKDALDNLESLEELTGNKTSLIKNQRALNEGEDYIDYTKPADWYYQQATAYPSYYGQFNEFFSVINNVYQEAKLNNSLILESDNLEYFNVWYQDGEYTNRVTYNEATNDLICESFLNSINEYKKINIGINEDGKLYYSYFSASFSNEIILYNGLASQQYVEYLEDRRCAKNAR